MGIVVTRPVHQADRLCQMIEDRGGNPIRFPALQILPPQDTRAALALIERLDDYEIAIFVSANAVRGGLALIRERRELPAHLCLIAIGRGTARELDRWGSTAWLAPENAFGSGALLEMPKLQTVAGRRIAIFSGEGGSELLGRVLRERGAHVTYAEVYRCGKPRLSADVLLRHWERHEIQAVVVTSKASLRNLFAMVGERGQQWLCRTPLIVVSTPARELARELGFVQTAVLAKEASDEGIVEALLEMAPRPIRAISEDS
jgi:uroporphyrinogen-III synthase